MSTDQRRVLFIAAMAGAVAFGASCGGSDGGNLCTGPKLLPDQSPINMGEMFPPKKDVDENPGDNTRVPFERTVLLESTCSKTVNITSSCLVGESDQGDNDTKYFTKEGPTKTSVPTDEESAVRLNYERESPNKNDDVDNVALVIQSNAKNFPTMVVPYCARVVKEGQDRKPISCSVPVDPPPKGEKKSGLCNGGS